MHLARWMVDAHVHLFGVANIDKLDSLRERTGAERMGLACIYNPRDVNSNPAAFAAKAAYPDRFHVFAALDHSRRFSDGSVSAPSLEEQVDRALRIGADGMKLLETKPDRRKVLGIAIDDSYFEGFFGRVEEMGVPLLWHVADPPEFWNPESTPKWAAVQGWGYDGSFVPYEQLQGEAANVLRRHPRLKVIFAHFLFMSQNLKRASAILDAHQGVHFDLAPGIEMLYNLSRDADASREFFERYSDRIIFGTDIFGKMSPNEAEQRAGIVRRFLETEDEFRVPEGADYLLGPPEDGVIRGLRLSSNAVEDIYHGNIERLLGERPRPLDAGLALEECERIAQGAKALGGDVSEADQAARRLEAMSP